MIRILAVLLIASSAGCTSVSLERHALNQALSVVDIRYSQILDGLAAVADNPGTLPSFSLCANGTTKLSDIYGLDSTTTWDHAVLGFSKQALGLSLKHAPDESWTLDPVVSEPQLRALHAAYMWALFGPPPEGSPEAELLREPDWEEASGFHFGVADQLAALPQCWLHVGSLADVPANACYKSRHNGTCVWVNASGIAGLSAFTLVVLDISTVDLKSLVPPTPTATVERYLSLDADGKPVNQTTVSETWLASQSKPRTGPCRQHPIAGDVVIERPKKERPVPNVGTDYDCKREAVAEGGVRQPEVIERPRRVRRNTIVPRQSYLVPK